MPKKIGRPRVPKGAALGEFFSVRLRREDAQEVRDAIRASGQNRAEWLRGALLTAAGQTRPGRPGRER